MKNWTYVKFSYDYDEIISNVKIQVPIALWEICYRTYFLWKYLCEKGTRVTMATEKEYLE